VASYRVAFTASAEKELHRLPAKMVARMMPRFEQLAETPRPPGCKKLKGGDNEWRIRVGDYRIVDEIDDAAKTVDVTRIAHRRGLRLALGGSRGRRGCTCR
jgi:mRNA interferase RelE/StbE